MVKQGYAKASKGLGSVYYFMTREGLDWLGEQTSVNIHDVED
jgi:predicted transcriptional regulator